MRIIEKSQNPQQGRQRLLIILEIKISNRPSLMANINDRVRIFAMPVSH